MYNKKPLIKIEELPEILTVSQVSEILWKSKDSTFYQRTMRILKKGLFHSFKIGKRHYVKKSTILSWINRQDNFNQ